MMVKILLGAPTKEEAEAKREAYFARWPSPGYGTMIKHPEQSEDGTWICVGWRGSSCD